MAFIHPKGLHVAIDTHACVGGFNLLQDLIMECIMREAQYRIEQ